MCTGVFKHLRVFHISCVGLETVDAIYLKYDPIEVFVGLTQPEAIKSDIRNANMRGELA